MTGRQPTWDELEHPPRLRPARPGESFTLILDRNPSGTRKPSKRKPGKTVIDKPGLSINRWAEGRRRNQVRRQIHEEIAAAVEAQGCPSFLDCRPVVQVTYYFADERDRDWQNWVPKPINDALKHCGVILDDCDRLADIRQPVLKVDRCRPRIEVLLQDSRSPEGA